MKANYCILFLTLLFFKHSAGQSDNVNLLVSKIRNNANDSVLIKQINTACIKFYFEGEVDSAIIYCQKTIDASKTNNVFIARTYNILANCYELKGAYTIVLNNYFKALSIYEQNGYRYGIANIYNNIGNTYSKNGYFNEALVYHNKALKIRLSILDSVNIALSYNNIATTYHKKKEYLSALNYNQKALKIKEILKDTAGIVMCLNNLGGTYAEVGESKKAIDVLIRSNKLIQLTEANKQDYGINYLNLSKAFYTAKDYTNAKKWGLEALKYANEFNDFGIKMDAYNLLGLSFKRLNDLEQALYFIEEYIYLKDSVFNSENSKRLIKEQLEYSFNKKAELAKLEEIKRNEKLKADKEKQKQIFMFLVFIIVATLVFAVFIYRGYLQKRKSNLFITKQNSLIKEKQKEIIDSINYAKRIQTAILPETDVFVKSFSDAFVLYKPKDIVSGDLYWYAEVTTSTSNPMHLKVLAVADCTGHGVPGAFMSMLSVQLLNESVKNPNINSPSELLNYMNKRILTDLRKNNNLQINDGLDIAVCALDSKSNKLYFSGANRPLWVLSNGNLNEFKPTKASIGGATDINQEFEGITVVLNKGDKVLLFTDGITDQFGGINNKKFTKARLKALIEKNADLDFNRLQVVIQNELTNWQGHEDQTDDILIVGFTL